MRKIIGIVLLAAAGCSPPSPKPSAALSIARGAFGADVGRGATFRHDGARWSVGRQLLTSISEADGLVRIAHGQKPAAWIEQRPSGLRPRRATVADSALVFADVADGVDVVMHAEEHRFEELRVITRREGLAPMRWSLRLGPGLSTLRLRDRRIEALEEDGTARLATAPIVAYDAHGALVRTGIDLHPSSEGWELVLTPDVSAELPVTVDPAWAPTGAMLETRAHTSLVDLGDGTVLAVGGSGSPYGNPIATSTVEKWDPKTSTWSSVAAMANNRVFSSAVRLADGRVLVAGGAREGIAGYPLGRCWQSAEIYDPKADKWTMAATMAVMRGMAGMHLLNDGRVLLFGGSSCGGPLGTSEIYDPKANVWSPGPSLPRPQIIWGRWAAVGVDRLLVAGEAEAAPQGPVTVFDGSKFTEIGAIANDGRTLPDSVVALGGGKALVMNGFYGSAGSYVASNKAEIFDLATMKLTAAANTDGRWSAAAAALPGGKVMVLGGQQDGSLTAGATIYDPTTDTWTPTSTSLSGPRRDLGAIVTAKGQVLAVGSQFGAKEVDVYDACATGFAADGVCCDKACTGPCERCDLPGKVGTCSPIAAGAPRALRTCGDYLCGTTGACIAKCSADADCVAGRYCDAAGACTAKKDKGAACAATHECASGFCVDGVCCDSACDGQCEACDLTGIAGTCGPVEGKVHGSRTPCEGAADQCGKLCDGTDRKACVWRGADVSCGDDGCLGNVARKKGVCTEGKCLGEVRDCSPYRCGTGGCPSACRDASDCTAGFVCVESACVAPPKETRCSDDRRSVLAFDGSVKQTCVDYLCQSGACLLACTSSSDCFPGLVCTTDSRTCVVPAIADAGDDGGCAMGSSPKPLGAMVFALMLLGLVSRRRGTEGR